MQGASAIQAVLEQSPGAPLRVFVVWEPVLLTDWTLPTTSALARISDPRAAQFWDHSRLLSEKMRDAGARSPLAGSVIWDFVALFPPGARWDAAFPQPALSGAPVADLRGDVRSLLLKGFDHRGGEPPHSFWSAGGAARPQSVSRQ